MQSYIYPAIDGNFVYLPDCVIEAGLFLQVPFGTFVAAGGPARS